ncbi:hypothetical protein BDN71DRAFT_1579358 [Pleurotus eryngii]|uniref:Uncharacterized protein n=1 Tax=Pleurotus eryngii TaxID=5323 RepID=A0A9P5ZR04_PLEER|nr:hypothetical protein BDN71DRAFT_1579358 [Pleurotus eryngii]
MSAIIAYDVSSQQAVTTTFTELQQQLLAQVTASTGLTWFMENQKEMYTFAKRASNRKFKQEIEAKWLITWTLSTLKEKTDKLVREFFDNPRTKTACTIAKATWELQKQQQSEGGQADQSGMDSRKKEERVAEAKDTMEVDGTAPLGMPKAPAPKEKGKGNATGMATSGAGKAMEEITECKIVAPKKCATVKLKSMVSSETDEAGEAGPLVAGPSNPEPSSDEDEEFPELSDDDEESNTGKQWNPCWQAKPRKGSMALLKVEIMERNMHGTTCLLSLGLTNGEFELGCRHCLKADIPCQRLARNLPHLPNVQTEGGGCTSAGRVASVRAGDKSVDGRHGLTNRRVGLRVEQRSEPAYQAGGSAENRTLVSEWAQRHSITPIAPTVTEPAEPAPAAPSSLPLLLPDMPPPPSAVLPPHTPLPALHHALLPSQGPTSPSTPPPCLLSPTHSPSLAYDLPTAPLPPGPSQVQATSEDVNMDLASSPAVAALIITVQELTPYGNTTLANLSHALAQLQVPPPWMTRAQSATLTETLRQSTRLASWTPMPDDSKAAKQKATKSALTKTKRLKK